jgi:hypothetical protein
MKTTLTQHVIEEIAEDVSFTRRCTHWLDVLHNHLFEADDEWVSELCLAEPEPHPVTRLIDAVYHDLIAAGYRATLKERDEFEDLFENSLCERNNLSR